MPGVGAGFSAPGRSRGPWWVWLLAAAAIAVVVAAAALVVAVVAGDGADEPAPITGPTAAVRDGQLEFVAGRADCSRDVLSDRRARGKWCTVELHVRHRGDTPVGFDAASVRGIDSGSSRYAPDPTVTGRLSPGLPGLTREVGEGDEFTVTLAFDVGVYSELVGLFVFESPLSAGTRLDLPK